MSFFYLGRFLWAYACIPIHEASLFREALCFLSSQNLCSNDEPVGRDRLSGTANRMFAAGHLGFEQARRGNIPQCNEACFCKHFEKRAVASRLDCCCSKMVCFCRAQVMLVEPLFQELSHARLGSASKQPRPDCAEK